MLQLRKNEWIHHVLPSGNDKGKLNSWPLLKTLQQSGTSDNTVKITAQLLNKKKWRARGWLLKKKQISITMVVCSTAISFQSIALKRTNLIRGTSWRNEFWMSNFTTCTLFFWYLMMPRGYCDYRCSAAEFVCNLKISLLVYYSVFAHTALSKCEDCLCPMNCADGTEGHALCMCVNEWMTVRLRELAWDCLCPRNCFDIN